jgi:hypothetical protein
MMLCSFVSSLSTPKPVGSVDFRKFYLSPTRDVVYWQSHSSTKTVFDSRIDIDSIDAVWSGQLTPGFALHDAPRELAPVSFSIIYANRTKCVECIAPSRDEYEAWTEGLTQLCRAVKAIAAERRRVAVQEKKDKAAAAAAAAEGKSAPAPTPAPAAAPAVQDASAFPKSLQEISRM